MTPIAPDDPITPDEKDWTWVLERPCPECGHEAARVDLAATPTVLADATEQLVAVLDRPDVGERRQPDRWSDLEYVCHVRDVFRRFDGRIALMLAEDDPLFPNWDQDATAVEDDYRSQDPVAVGEELRDASATYLATVAALTPEQLERPGRRSDGASFTVETLIRYMAHDPVHHVWDVDEARTAAV
jgi:DinB superfamily